MTIRLHIERLVLYGVDVVPGQRPLLQASLEAELARLLTSRGVLPEVAAGGALSQLSGADIQWGGNDMVHLGGQIARSVYSGIGE